MYILKISIYEEATNYKYPVVEHRFTGKTQEEALGYFKAHLKTDSFLSDIYYTGKWNNVIGRYTIEMGSF